MIARLLARAGPERGKVYPLDSEKMGIGRDPSSEVFLNDPKISRRHAELSRRGEEWILRDLGSRNGTVISGRPVKETVLQPGDLITLGESCLYFELTSQEEPLPSEEGVAPPNITQTLEITLSQPAATSDDPEAFRKMHERLTALLKFNQRTGRLREASELLAETVSTVRRIVEADRVVPVLCRGEELVPWPGTTEPPGREPREVPLSSSIIRYALKHRRSVLSERTGRDERFRGGKSVSAARIATAVCAPLVHEGPPMGALYVDRLGKTPPFGRDELEAVTAFALIAGERMAAIREREAMGQAVTLLERELRPQWLLVGRSLAIQEVLRLIEQVAPTDATVLVTGESGTGKELVARAIHRSSPRRAQPFEVINCAVLSDGLAEDELFGHERGAFTGADVDRPGRFELADGGTIFLDDIAELAPNVQTTLLRILEDKRVRRLGETKDRKIDVRIIAAARDDLEEKVRDGAFREDLFYRLHVLRIAIPPLRERPEDLEPLCEHFLALHAQACGRKPIRISARGLALLKTHPWPGNVRELKNFLERVTVFTPSKETLGPEDLPPLQAPGSGEGRGGPPLSWKIEELELRHIDRVLKQTEGNKARAASLLGIDRSTLYAKIKKYGL
jgi:Nif-specific regulatory protein